MLTHSDSDAMNALHVALALYRWPEEWRDAKILFSGVISHRITIRSAFDSYFSWQIFSSVKS